MSTLDEGATHLDQHRRCDLDSLKIGQKVKVVFKPSETGQKVPFFTPA